MKQNYPRTTDVGVIGYYPVLFNVNRYSINYLEDHQKQSHYFPSRTLYQPSPNFNNRYLFDF